MSAFNREPLTVRFVRTEGSEGVLRFENDREWRIPLAALPSEAKPPTLLRLTIQTPKEHAKNHVQLTRALLEEMLNGQDSVPST